VGLGTKNHCAGEGQEQVNSKVGGRAHRQQIHFVNLLTKLGEFADRWTYREFGDFISLLLFFQNKEIRLKVTWRSTENFSNPSFILPVAMHVRRTVKMEKENSSLLQ
jgi:hypothetical protein